MKSDLELLHARITRFTAHVDPVSDGWRSLAASDKGTAIDMLYREIEETARARRLTFRDDQGGTADLLVKSGAVLKVEAAATLDAFAAIRHLVGQELDANDDQHVALLATAISRFAAASKSLSVRSEPVKPQGAGAGRGIPFTRLKTQPPQTEASHSIDPARFIQSFLDQCGDRLEAVLWTDAGTEVRKVGSDARLQKLDALAEAEPATRQDVEIGPATCFILSGQDMSASAVLCGCAGPALVLAVFAAEDTADVLAIWQAAQKS